jgi:hypothetical protein
VTSDIDYNQGLYQVTAILKDRARFHVKRTSLFPDNLGGSRLLTTNKLHTRECRLNIGNSEVS